MTRRLTVWLAGAAVLLAVFALVGCVVATTVTPVKAAQHPGYTAGTACDASGCHTPNYFKPAYQHKQPYLGPCEVCHTLASWKPAVYAHKDKTFDNGMHPLIGCAMCHTEGQPLPSKECSSCHESPHGGFKACVNCHTTNAWGIRKPLPEGHVSLLGGHSKLDCFSCHKDTKSLEKARTCTDCHGTNHGGLTKCQDCHDPSTEWKPKEGWNHDVFFKRVGAHAKLDCTDCHKGGRFANTPRVCVGCHGKQHGGLTDCGSCHSPSAAGGFKSTSFRHSSVFALTGRHAKLACTECHAKRQYARVLGNGSHKCVSCHGSQHGGLTDCAACHTTSGFASTTFNHSKVFPLVGRHATLRCDQCHPSDNTFLPKPGNKCVDCHGVKHGDQTQCQTCHSNAAPSFVPALSFTARHPIPIGGTHADTSKCTRCHRATGPGSGPVFNTAIPACVTCHAGDVPHVGPTDCIRCHWPTTWADSHFTHAPVMFGSNPVPAVPHNALISGTYPTDCLNCHPGPGGNPNFTAHSCSNGTCHQ